MTDLQKLRTAYAHFTLEEWKLLARCVRYTFGDLDGTKAALNKHQVNEMLSRFPSASLGE